MSDPSEDRERPRRAAGRPKPATRGSAGGAARGGVPRRDAAPRGDAPSARRDRTPRDGTPRDGAPRRDGKPRDGKPRDGKLRDGGPRRDGGAPRRDGAAPWRDGVNPRPGAGVRSGAPAGRGRPAGSERRPPRSAGEDARPRHDDPTIPDDVDARQLDKVARAELRTLSKDNAEWVARHLVMAGRLIDDDPALAHRHALAAARRAGRIGVVRETVAITAYATGDFALALRELRTYRRLTGRNDELPLMVDSERGVGRPDRALELGHSAPRAELDAPVQVALAIAMSGARLDLGQPEAALTELQIPQLDPERAFAWSPALFDAYATVLEELGRDDEAEQWWQRSDRATIALEQAAIPEGEDTVEIIEEILEPAPDPVSEAVDEGNADGASR